MVVTAEKSRQAAGMEVKEVSRVTGFSNAAIYRAIERGDLPVLRLGKRILVARVAVVKLLADAGLAMQAEAMSVGVGGA